MDLLKKLAVSLLALILFSSSLGMAWADAASRTFRDREVVKGWLEESGFYGNITDALLENFKAENESEEGLPLEDPALKASLSKALDEDFVRQNSSKLLDGFYDWAEGNTDEFELEIGTEEFKERIAGAVGDYAESRAAALPVCSRVPSETDPLKATCLPRGTTPEEIAQQARNELLNNEEFLSDNTVTSDELQTENQPLSEISDGGENFRTAYNFGSYGAFLFGLIALLSIVGIILLSPAKTMGLRRAGLTLISSGAALAVGYFLLHFVPSWFNEFISSQQNIGTTTNSLITNLVNAVTGDIKKIIGIYTAVYILLGIGMMIAARQIKKRRHSMRQEGDALNPEPPIDDSAPIPAEKTKSKDTDKTKN